MDINENYLLIYYDPSEGWVVYGWYESLAEAENRLQYLCNKTDFLSYGNVEEVKIMSPAKNYEVETISRRIKEV